MVSIRFKFNVGFIQSPCISMVGCISMRLHWLCKPHKNSCVCLSWNKVTGLGDYTAAAWAPHWDTCWPAVQHTCMWLLVDEKHTCCLKDIQMHMQRVWCLNGDTRWLDVQNICMKLCQTMKIFGACSESKAHTGIPVDSLYHTQDVLTRCEKTHA